MCDQQERYKPSRRLKKPGFREFLTLSWTMYLVSACTFTASSSVFCRRCTAYSGPHQSSMHIALFTGVSSNWTSERLRAWFSMVVQKCKSYFSPSVHSQSELCTLTMHFDHLCTLGLCLLRIKWLKNMASFHFFISGIRSNVIHFDRVIGAPLLGSLRWETDRSSDDWRWLVWKEIVGKRVWGKKV